MERQQLHGNGPWVEMNVLTCVWASCIILSLTWWSIVSEDCFMAAIWGNASSPAMTIKTIPLLSQQAATVTRGNGDRWRAYWYGCLGNEGLPWVVWRVQQLEWCPTAGDHFNSRISMMKLKHLATENKYTDMRTTMATWGKLCIFLERRYQYLI